jgi:hypothetical protein
MSNASWRPLETATIRLSSCVIVGRSTGWPTGLGQRRSSGRLGTTLEAELGRYDAVIHLRTPGQENGYNHQNPLRTESANAAADIDARIERAWEQHARRFIVESSTAFLDKASKALEILRDELPECCRQHVVPAVRDRHMKSGPAGAHA